MGMNEEGGRVEQPEGERERESLTARELRERERERERERPPRRERPAAWSPPGLPQRRRLGRGELPDTQVSDTNTTPWLHSVQRTARGELPLGPVDGPTRDYLAGKFNRRKLFNIIFTVID